MTRMFRSAAVVALAAVMAAGAAAHQGKEAVTRVLFNDRTGNIEVMHRFLVHDAEHAARELMGAEADILASSETRDRFAAYVSERFSLSDQTGTPLPLRLLGHEIEGRYLWVYSETPIPDALDALTMTHDALRDVWPEQVNLVNVDRDGATQSALFAGGTPSLTIDLETSR